MKFEEDLIENRKIFLTRPIIIEKMRTLYGDHSNLKNKIENYDKRILMK